MKISWIWVEYSTILFKFIYKASLSFLTWIFSPLLQTLILLLLFLIGLNFVSQHWGSNCFLCRREVCVKNTETSKWKEEYSKNCQIACEIQSWREKFCMGICQEPEDVFHQPLPLLLLHMVNRCEKWWTFPRSFAIN